MIIIEFLGLFIGTVQRLAYFRFWALMHANTEVSRRIMLVQTEAEIFRCKDPASVRARWKRSGMEEDSLHLFVRDDTSLLSRAEALRKEMAHHAEMRRRFERACWFPWINVRIKAEPDR